MGKQRKSKTALNNEYIQKAYDLGREHVFKSELPYPQIANRVSKQNVLVVEGSVIYLRSKI